MKLNWLAFKGLITAAFIAGSVLLTVPAKAATYRAGDFTVTISDDSTYIGCDSKGNCLSLDNYQNWHYNGQRGIFWVNGEYVYSVSWQEGVEGMFLKVRKGDEVLVYEEMHYLGY